MTEQAPDPQERTEHDHQSGPEAPPDDGSEDGAERSATKQTLDHVVHPQIFSILESWREPSDVVDWLRELASQIEWEELDDPPEVLAIGRSSLRLLVALSRARVDDDLAEANHQADVLREQRSYDVDEAREAIGAARDALTGGADAYEGERVLPDGGQQVLQTEPNPFGIADLAKGDELRVVYETPRSDYDQTRFGEVANVRPVEDEYGPTGSTEIVLQRRDENDLILWPAWDEIRSDAAGRLGEIVEVTRTDRADEQLRIADDDDQAGTIWLDCPRCEAVGSILAEGELRCERCGETFESEEVA